jgi:electron transport complex protein RnfD
MDESLIREQEVQLQKTGRYYKHICFMAVPVLWMACFLYGVRPLLLCGIAVLTGNLCDRLVSLLRRRVYQAGDFSNESFALVIALLMPVTVDIYVLIIAVLAGVLIGKEIFGGYGSYPFNPAAVGYVVAAVSWPEQVFRYPQPYTSIPLWDASMVPVSSTIEDTLRSGGMLNIRSLVLSLGEYAAPMGTGAALVILASLWVHRKWVAPRSSQTADDRSLLRLHLRWYDICRFPSHTRFSCRMCCQNFYFHQLHYIQDRWKMKNMRKSLAILLF